MHIGRARHAHVRSNRSDEFGIEPIGAFSYICLFAPHFRAGRRKIAVPVIETHADAAQHLQKAASARITQHGHRWNGRETDVAVRSIFFRSVNRGRGDDLQNFIPTGASESAFAARLVKSLAPRFILNDGCPRLDWVFMFLFGFAPHIQQHAAYIRIFDSHWAVLIPRKGNATLTAARLIRRHVCIQDWVIQRLQFPGDDSIFDIDHPRTATSTIYAVCTSYHFVMLPAIAIKLFPLAGLRVRNFFDPAHNNSFCALLTNALRTLLKRSR